MVGRLLRNKLNIFYCLLFAVVAQAIVTVVITLMFADAPDDNFEFQSVRAFANVKKIAIYYLNVFNFLLCREVRDMIQRSPTQPVTSN